MGWLDDLDGQVVGIDTAPVIYFIEAHPVYLPVVKPFFQQLEDGRFTAVTSTITLLEVLVHPLRQNRSDLVHKYRLIIRQAKGLTLYGITLDIAEQAAALRAAYNLRAPDAIQIAASIYVNAPFFLTNDHDLQRVTELDVLVLDNLI